LALAQTISWNLTPKRSVLIENVDMYIELFALKISASLSRSNSSPFRIVLIELPSLAGRSNKNFSCALIANEISADTTNIIFFTANSQADLSFAHHKIKN
jgi:hypothetical protein